MKQMKNFGLRATEMTELAEEVEGSRNWEPAQADKRRERNATPRGVHPAFIMLLLCTTLVGVLGLLPERATSAAELPPEQPELFAPARPCSSTNTMHRAVLAEDAANAKSERSVFDLQDGVAAVSLYEEASDCYRRAGQSVQAERADAYGKQLRQSLLGEYKRSRLRLERALAAEQNEVASEQVRRLQELLRHQNSSATSLALRRLALRLSRKN